MRIIAKRTLIDFWAHHADSAGALKAWHDEARKAHWKTSQDIKRLFKTASFLNDNRVVFNISGNRYRLIVRIDYTHEIVFIRFVGTHADYDKIKAEEI